MSTFDEDDFWTFDDEDDPIDYLKKKVVEFSVLHPLGRPCRIDNQWISVITKDKSECQFILEEDSRMVHYYPKGSYTPVGKKIWKKQKGSVYTIKIKTTKRPSQMVIDSILNEEEFSKLLELHRISSETVFYLKTAHVLQEKRMALALGKFLEYAGESYNITVESVKKLTYQ